MAELYLVPKRASTESAETALSDWEARRQALDVHRSWIVEAPAGSGKTGLLIQRFLKLLADESVEQPEQVLAITFTIKATAEMRGRIAEQLRRAAEPDLSKNDFDRETRALAQAVLQRDAHLGWQLLDHPHRLNVRTIDSVCAEIAQSLPVLSGGGGGLSPVKEASALYSEAARRTWMELGGQDEELDRALRTLLLHRDGNLRDCETLLAEILELRNQWGDFLPLVGTGSDDVRLDEAVYPRLQHTLEQMIRAGLERLSSVFPKDVLNELAALAGEMGHADGYKGGPSPLAVCAGVHEAPLAKPEDIERWRALIHLLVTNEGKWRGTTSPNHLSVEIEPRQKARLKRIHEQLRGRDDLLLEIGRVSRLPPAKYPDEQWVVTKALIRVLSRALAELQLVFAEHGECDFVELGLLAASALEHEDASAGLAAAFGMRLQHLLVDEMQDTSTGQYRLIELLTQGWDGQSQTVFLVGDPKQSIYLFRQARVERFVRTMLTGELGQLTVGRLQLTANFRSQEGLVNAFNRDFALLFPREANAASPEEVPYVEAAPVRAATDTFDLVWHGHDMSGNHLRASKQTQARSNAQAIREIIERWRTRPLPQDRSEPWKIAVLVRSRTVLADIIAEFQKTDGSGPIPYRAVDIEELGERQEVLDLYALTRTLLHPADRIAWLAVLRAPWCGLELAELHILAGADDPACAKRAMGDVIAERGHLLSEKSCERLTRLWPVLRAAWEQRQAMTTAECVERTWRSLGGDAYLAPHETANARRYLQLLDELETRTGTVDPTALKQHMSKLFAQAYSGADAVELMTIHSAKGLEWDVVIVPALEKPPRRTTRQLLTWDEFASDDDSAHVVLAPIAGKGEGSKSLNDWLNGVHADREAAELKRLFYVACTRAKEELHLFAVAKKNSKDEVSLPAGSLLKAVWPAAERHLVPIEFASASGDREDAILALAAAEEPVAAPMLRRLPLEFDPLARLGAIPHLTSNLTDSQSEARRFIRPEGSLDARAFGNAVHAFLEVLAQHAREGTSMDALLQQIAEWEPRIAAVLRADGVSPTAVRRRTKSVQVALVQALENPEGRWILTAQQEASSEFALTSWREERASVRMDRIFRAGPEPLLKGSECLWIVDYKTSTHGREGIDQFLLDEKAKYTGQMEAYARMMRLDDDAMEIRVGLYYPMLPKLIWWNPAV
ncbi:UvrD-helicase domain-containing protein [Edaphobacter sp.]|uniref:UvrD-helicase domain-containing protein n=1 Tax=Edaphobacter sp. TaxID=1934404 RepID=UPI002DBFA0C3|nr:UvrD-helicase domain-containing protein [Edaphobacter sp.]HEU5340934.1 UvrD-helicase domain-containing protein [Edaphobacter sp.]